MTEPKNDRNPDELQPQTISDDDAERWAKNYAAMEELEDFDPELIEWYELKSKERNEKRRIDD